MYVYSYSTIYHNNIVFQLFCHKPQDLCHSQEGKKLPLCISFDFSSEDRNRTFHFLGIVNHVGLYMNDAPATDARLGANL